MQPITPRQQQVLDFITTCLDDHGCPPTLREISEHIGTKGTATAILHLEALERKGYVNRREGSSRNISLVGRKSARISIPIVGTVRAGHLSPAIEDIQGYFPVDYIGVKGEGCFFLRVSGDSMINAGILDGDLALVHPQPAAENGDTVVAMIHGEATLKLLYKEDGHIRLQPANSTMQPIVINPEDGDVTLVGKVIGVYRPMV